MKYAFFVAGFVVAALLAGIYVWRKGPIKPFAGGDDEPIVVAGGSLDFASLNGWKKDTNDPNGYTAIHKHPKRTVTIGLIVYNNNGAPVVQQLPAGHMELEIAYCNGTGACNLNNPDDKVIIRTDSDGSHLRVINNNSQHKIGEEADDADAHHSTTISHQPDFKIHQIRDVVNNPNQPYHCDNFKCQIVLVHYCNNSGNCQ